MGSFAKKIQQQCNSRSQPQLSAHPSGVLIPSGTTVAEAFRIHARQGSVRMAVRASWKAAKAHDFEGRDMQPAGGGDYG
eukprot:CAMPEP_0181203522 /NCGR_PEP_ID=MMETSP1096-20121128/19432_1 /TAXON_ID=156174 ORGANISM="Chrysochromulina ericina, Strain CCMP281" /NCGR_SAMPLE_ID=MMETSP1096 /ASSEMBLY_ACC=CAM_ASM_000453 /LENGTH=78 /DNA_ID=CAMNT_0023294131 /DNA_START=188 /DNA_END=424 /DNA_ORIENTATION=-